jgi:pyrophosphatase PpaX
MNNKYKVLLFDLDGTLCDTDEMLIQSFFALYKKYRPAKIRTREELIYFSGPPIKKTLVDEFPDYTFEEIYKAFQETSRELYLPYVKAFDKEIETLKKLRKAGYLLGVVTNKGAPLTKYSLEVSHIDGLFDVVISADDVNAPKPSPLGIEKALERLAIANKEEVLYIGDNDIDYETASNAGVDAMLVTWGPREIKCIKAAKYAVSSYNELGGLLL